jgi:hypothetical protein
MLTLKMLFINEETIYPNIKRCASPELVIAPAPKRLGEVLPRQKNVTFFQIVTIKAHDHFRDMSLEEREATWYKKENYIEMKKECIPAVRLLLKGAYPGDTDVLCKRGIEYRTPKGSKQRKMKQRVSVQAVRSAQDLDGDDESIRSEYIKYSALEQLNAQKVGCEDALEAAALYYADFQGKGMPWHDKDMILTNSSGSEKDYICREAVRCGSADGNLLQHL